MFCGLSKMKCLHVSGRRWFQKSYGSTYSRVRIYSDGYLDHTSDIEYGYGDYYLQMAVSALKTIGRLNDIIEHDNGGNEGLQSYCRRKGIAFTCDVTDVARERDL